jgi:DNA modification methylase
MKSHRKQRAFARLQWRGRTDEETPPVSLTLAGEFLPSRASLEKTEFRNRLISGENAGVMAALLPEFEGKIDLIYADPPFLSGKAYAARVGRGEDSRRPSEWQTIEGYQDTWPDGASYLNMLHTRLRLMHRLLSSTGTLYLHLDWHASAYARVMLDELFGPKHLLNEIIWTYHGPSPIRKAFKRKHDTILVYTKSKRYTFNADAVRVAYDPNTVKTFESSSKAGFGKNPDLARGKVPEDWWYFPVVARLHSERTGYPTQKPEALLERVLKASSNPSDLVLDPFCGAGTTAVVASRLGRRWIACDVNPLAVHTSYRRLLLADQPAPFTLWQAENDGSETRLQPEFTIDTSDRTASVKLEGVQKAPETPSSFPENIVLWEIDWDHDGEVFRSQSQAVRDFRKGELNLVLRRDFPSPGEYGIAVRAIDAVGNSGIGSMSLHLRK